MTRVSKEVNVQPRCSLYFNRKALLLFDKSTGSKRQMWQIWQWTNECGWTTLLANRMQKWNTKENIFMT